MLFLFIPFYSTKSEELPQLTHTMSAHSVKGLEMSIGPSYFYGSSFLRSFGVWGKTSFGFDEHWAAKLSFQGNINRSGSELLQLDAWGLDGNAYAPSFLTELLLAYNVLFGKMNIFEHLQYFFLTTEVGGVLLFEKKFMPLAKDRINSVTRTKFGAALGIDLSLPILEQWSIHWCSQYLIYKGQMGIQNDWSNGLMAGYHFWSEFKPISFLF